MLIRSKGANAEISYIFQMVLLTFSDIQLLAFERDLLQRCAWILFFGWYIKTLQ